MTSTLDASRAIHQAAFRAFLAGDRRQALDLYRMDANAAPTTFERFEIDFARRLVTAGPQEFVAALMQRAYDAEHLVDVRAVYRSALDALERMNQTDTLDLEYKLLRAQPHDLTAPQAADIVLRLMGNR